MKVAVTSLGETIESPVDRRFGRARYFIIFDTNAGNWTVEDNRRNFRAESGAGIQSARHVIQLGTEAVITGHCGPKAFATLSTGGVDIYQEAEGNVGDALEAFQSGKLQKAGQANVGRIFGQRKRDK